MKITILTKPPKNFFNIFSFYLADGLKRVAKKILFIPDYGLSAVLKSLLRGFNALGIDYQVNPEAKRVSDIVCVVSGIDALRWAIEAKKKGEIKKIIAGPNLVITPKDAGGILLDETIDLVVVPSEWVKNFYASFQPGFGKKIRVWGVGVENPKNFKERPRKGCLVYKKRVDDDLFNFVIQYLKSQNIDYKLIKWGRYKKERYFDLLNRVKFMIYLSESESQGIALHEAWMRNVPTFVWNREYWKWRDYQWQESSSAPYLAEDCGMFFKDKDDFVNKFNTFIKNLSNFKPREYSLKNFTDEISASNYLKIIDELI
ncbi:MAG: hypothetical protein QMC93_03555 [Patescibacteria group bacterium]|nr:hypothetical protein [Patescibacteria group bacterium]